MKKIIFALILSGLMVGAFGAYKISRLLDQKITFKISPSPYAQGISTISNTLNYTSYKELKLNRLLALEMRSFSNKLARKIERPKFFKVKKKLALDTRDLVIPEITKEVVVNSISHEKHQEIDDRELISDIKFEAQLPQVIAWTNFKVDLDINEEAVAEVKKDEVKVVQSSPLKVEEPLMIDLNDENVFANPELPDLPSSVKLALAREIERPDTQALTPVPNLNLAAINGLSAPVEEEEGYKIVASATTINKGISDPVYEYDFIHEYDKSNVVTPDSEGEITFKDNLNSESGILRGTILARNYMRTKIDMTMSSQSKRFLNIPLIDEYSFYEFLDKENVQVKGGHLLLELSEEIRDAELDKGYTAKIYLDKDFKVVDSAPAPFILFIGVEPGNALVMLDLGKTRSEKIVQISEEEILYNDIEVANRERFEFSLDELNLLGRQTSPLNIMGKQLMAFNTKIKSEKLDVNTHVLTPPQTPLGFRNYFELTHLRESIFFGSNSSNKIHLPSEGLVSEVLNQLDVSELTGSCLIQVNLSKEANEFFIQGDTGTRELEKRMMFLDKDGEVGREINPTTTQAFIFGEGLGIFNIRVNYLDGKSDYLQTFCSPSTVLIEQL